MKILIKTLLACGLFLPFAAHAQVVKEEIIKVGKTKEKGFVAISDKYGKAQVKDILAAKLGEAGLKMSGKKSKFFSYQGVTWSVTGRNKVDILYRVVNKKHKTKIYFIASKGFNDYITSTTDINIARDISSFLAQIDTTIAINESVASKGQSVKETDAEAAKKADAPKAANSLNKPATSQPARLQSATPKPTY